MSSNPSGRSNPIPNEEITSKPSHESHAFPGQLLGVESQRQTPQGKLGKLPWLYQCLAEEIIGALET